MYQTETKLQEHKFGVNWLIWAGFGLIALILIRARLPFGTNALKVQIMSAQMWNQPLLTSLLHSLKHIIQILTT